MDIDVIWDKDYELGEYYSRFLHYIQEIRNLATGVYGWWEGDGGASFAQSLNSWASDFERLAERYKPSEHRLWLELNEWGETDSRYKYSGEEIVTLAELWDYLKFGLKPGGDGTDLIPTIDLKEFLTPSLPWFMTYPPESITIYQVDAEGHWSKVEITPADWSFGIKLAPAGASLEFEYTALTIGATWEGDEGFIGGAELKVLTVAIGTTAVGASALSAELSAGQNIGDTYVGGKVGGNLGLEIGYDNGEIGGGVVSGGLEIGEAKDVAPPGAR